MDSALSLSPRAAPKPLRCFFRSRFSAVVMPKEEHFTRTLFTLFFGALPLASPEVVAWSLVSLAEEVGDEEAPPPPRNLARRDFGCCA